ncbi:carbohydrate kinase family protein [Acholeplasma granularum]|uniref:carbohydrate kinase family protein n=1 Tax=Acholeplasma granularum TaxID=264635 RepID=UPI0004B81955|nr:carbohydrate kinase [Acholeplasma granularum]
MKVITMGELLIDFMPKEKGLDLTGVRNFIKHAGGAPANVSAVVAKLGGDATFLGQVGHDSFGHYLIDKLKSFNVDTSYIHQTSKALTSISFVSLKDNGERDFMFYRNPGADELYEAAMVPKLLFDHNIFHFCSVSLTDNPIKDAHLKAIKLTRENNGLVSFDPNIRLSLWHDHKKLLNRIYEFLDLADILKVANDELSFLTGFHDEKIAIKSLFKGSVKVIIITRGKEGARLYFKDIEGFIEHTGYVVDSIDTTGAGDAFMGAFLYQLSKNNLVLNQHNSYDILKFSNAYAALSTTKLGGMENIPSMQELKLFIKSN